VYDAWRRTSHVSSDTLEPSIDDPGGGSDFAGFYNHLGIPILDWGFGGREGMYHSAYDSFHWLEKFGDPKFQYHITTATLAAATILRIANADIIPYDYVAYARTMRVLAQSAAKAIAERGWTVSTDTLMGAISRMESAARTFNAVRDSALQHPLGDTVRARTNASLLQVERAFVRPEGLYQRSWFRNVIYAADNDNGYDNISLPTINEAVRAGDEPRTVKEIDSLAQAFDAASHLLEQAARSLRTF
jgi:N-acetylated-alpha-linked acidic dipeptidase